MAARFIQSLSVYVAESTPRLLLSFLGDSIGINARTQAFTRAHTCTHTHACTYTGARVYMRLQLPREFTAGCTYITLHEHISSIMFSVRIPLKKRGTPMSRRKMNPSKSYFASTTRPSMLPFTSPIQNYSRFREGVSLIMIDNTYRCKMNVESAQLMEILDRHFPVFFFSLR